MNEIRSTHAIDLPIFYRSVHCSAPDDAIDEEALLVAEKRIVISPWASDIYAAESRPGLHEVPCIGSSLGLAFIFAALPQPDSKDDLPPRGRAVIRLGRLDRATSHFERLSS